MTRGLPTTPRAALLALAERIDSGEMTPRPDVALVRLAGLLIKEAARYPDDTEPPVGSLRDVVDAAGRAVAAAETEVTQALRDLEATGEQLARVTQRSHLARALAAERELDRLRPRPSEWPTAPDATTAPAAPPEVVSGAWEREYDLQTRDADGGWSWVLVTGDRRTAAGIATALRVARQKFPDEQYRAIVRDLPPFRVLTDAELDGLVLAEAAREEGR